jgi:hypothetical protein
VSIGRLLETAEGKTVYSDGKGNFSLERDDVFNVAAEFVKMLPGDDAEKYRKRVSKQLGVEVRYED